MVMDDLVFVLLITTGLSVLCACGPYYHYDSSEEYDDIIYSDVGPPRFLFGPQHIVGKEEDPVTIPCSLSSETDSWYYRVFVWMMSKEKTAHKLLFIGKHKVAEDHRYSISNGFLEINKLQISDAGTYACNILNAHEEVMHTLEVQYQPRVKLLPTEVRALWGDSAEVKCIAKGNPTPVVYWSYQGGNLPSGDYQKEILPYENHHDENLRSGAHEEEDLPIITHSEVDHPPGTHHKGMRLMLKAVDYLMGTNYACSAGNNVSDVVTVPVSVIVEYPPQVTLSMDVVNYAGIFKVRLSCIVRAEPPANVTWGRDGVGVFPSNHTTEQAGNHHLLYWFLLDTKDDSGKYTCTAVNIHGNVSVTTNSKDLASGKISPPRFTSDPHGSEGSSYTLTWETESYSHILSYRLRHRKATVNNSTEEPEEWHDMMYSAGSLVPQGMIYTMTHNITGLAPATKYQAAVKVYSHLRWSDEAKFNFTTKGAQTVNSKAASVGPLMIILVSLQLLLRRI